jgi:hypothetical protein
MGQSWMWVAGWARREWGRGKPCPGRRTPFPEEGADCRHNGGMTLVVPQNEIDRERRDGDIVRLRLDGLTYREISAQVGLSISQLRRAGLDLICHLSITEIGLASRLIRTRAPSSSPR